MRRQRTIAVRFAPVAASLVLASTAMADTPVPTGTAEFQGAQRVAAGVEGYAEIPWPVGPDRARWPTYAGELRIDAWRLPTGTTPVLAWREAQRRLAAGGYRIVGQCAGDGACWNGADHARYVGDTFGRRKLRPSAGWPADVLAIASLRDSHLLRAERGAAGEREVVVVKIGLGRPDHEVREAREQPLALVARLDGRAAAAGRPVLSAEELRSAMFRDGRAVLRTLRFDADALTDDGDVRAQLDAVARWLAADPAVALAVVAHSERGVENAEAVTGRRARAVIAALVARGVDAERLAPRGLGTLAPLAGDDAAGRMANRRIELVPR